MMNHHLLLVLDPMEEGFVVLIVGLLVVFASLISLFLIFQYGLPGALQLLHRIKDGKSLTYKATKETGEISSGEEIAAVAAAIYIFLAQNHDEENAILTINKAQKDYSPWSSKIYMTHHVPPNQR
jgi:glutaconyl-CoA/methylmalonyl-CoA decarboxylase subunit delta